MFDNTMQLRDACKLSYAKTQLGYLAMYETMSMMAALA